MEAKRALVAATLALAAGAVSAQSISFTPVESVTFSQEFNPDGGIFTSNQFTSGQKGVFTADTGGVYQITYLGQESAFSDGLRIVINGSQLTEGNSVGDSVFGPMVAGQPIDFQFFGSDGSVVSNGSAQPEDHPSFALLGRDVQTRLGTFAYVIGYNDTALHDDWDDFVVGLTPIPEPSTYALLLAGLGVVGFVARRRRAS